VTFWRHLVAVLACPVVVTAAVPAVIVWRTGAGIEPLGLLSVPLIALGLLLVVSTVRLFATVGRGTLAPWDPTERLVVRGPYRYVRNPMISGVLCILLGEAVLFGSLPLLLWFAVVLAVNAVYLPLVEEPGLQRRFGEDYERYRTHVPRWIPRLRPWDIEETAG
jgi:protein-S-isoprenylcysteine O-methyltransferase Ste14